LTHTWSASTSADCAKIPGASFDAGKNVCTSTFLRHAIEIIGDLIGNDNGLCESNETCLYTPNLGAYQGHGTLVAAGTVTAGSVSNVTLLRYDHNGR
jgi:hypothetical protein